MKNKLLKLSWDLELKLKMRNRNRNRNDVKMVCMVPYSGFFFFGMELDWFGAVFVRCAVGGAPWRQLQADGPAVSDRVSVATAGAARF